ncbi:MAG: protein with DnaJ-like domain [Verrucomicrobiaceae bacterium]|nr:protein with DnaJ-like domain [Verrucomicrobiaceae bacterium]
MIIGKLIGAIVGVRMAGWVGLLFGLILGHYFDKAFSRARSGFSNFGSLPLNEHPFFATVFLLAGHLAKADGHINEAEIAGMEKLMAQFGLSGNTRNEAIALFKRGATPDFQLDAQLADFTRKTAFHPGLKRALIEYLVAFALADNVLHAAERSILQRVAASVGFNGAQFAQLLDMLQAQQHFHQRGYSQGYSAEATPRPDALANAYRALGVSADINDADLKKAYRKLMSQHHPDKLMSQGVPPDMLKMATEKTQEIQAAYELIEKARRV